MNTQWKVLLAAFCCLLFGAPLSAAPDGTRGMALMSASINADGTILRSTGVQSATHLGGANSGQYQVLFVRDVSECFYFGSIGEGIPSNTATSFIEVTALGSSAFGVFVETKTAADAGADRPFFVLVFCAQ